MSNIERVINYKLRSKDIWLTIFPARESHVEDYPSLKEGEWICNVYERNLSGTPESLRKYAALLIEAADFIDDLKGENKSERQTEAS
jgi:hypothetical protein